MGTLLPLKIQKPGGVSRKSRGHGLKEFMNRIFNLEIFSKNMVFFIPLSLILNCFTPEDAMERVLFCEIASIG